MSERAEVNEHSLSRWTREKEKEEGRLCGPLNQLTVLRGGTLIWTLATSTNSLSLPGHKTRVFYFFSVCKAVTDRSSRVSPTGSD